MDDEVARLATALHLNLSLAYGKCLKWQLAIEHAEAALAGLGVRVAMDGTEKREIAVDATTADTALVKKAYWRRGEALLALQHPERAVYDFVRVYAMEADAVQRKAYKGKVESVVGVLAKVPERMGGVMRGLVDDVLRVSPDGATGGATSSNGLEVVERVEDIDELTMREAAYLVVKEMEADGQKDVLEGARGTCCRWLLHLHCGSLAHTSRDDDGEGGGEGGGDTSRRECLSVPEALIWRSRVCCRAKGYEQARVDAVGALRLLEANTDGRDTSSLVFRRLVVSGYVALGKSLYAEAGYDGRDARRALKALRKAVLCLGIGESHGGLFDLVQEVTEGLTKESVDSVEREVGAEGTVLDRVVARGDGGQGGGGGAPPARAAATADEDEDKKEPRVDGHQRGTDTECRENAENDVEVTFVLGKRDVDGTLPTLTPFCREQLRVLVARAADVGVGKVGIEGVRVLGKQLAVRLGVETGVPAEALGERAAEAYAETNSIEVRQLREALGDPVSIHARLMVEEHGDEGSDGGKGDEGDQGGQHCAADCKAVVKGTKPQLQLALPFKEYKLVDVLGRPVERQQRHAFCMSRVYYDRSEMEGAETWVELADGSCRWRQSGSEIRLIALAVPSDIPAKHIEVRFEPYEICVRNKETGVSYLSGRLHRGIIPNDCFWTHMGGEGEDGFLITMTKMNLEVLQKHWMHSEMWWSKLFDDHPDIAWDDYAKDYSDLPEEVMERHRIKEAQKEETRALEGVDEKRRKRLAGEDERRKRTRMDRLRELREGVCC